MVSKGNHWTDKLSRFDRRWIFLAMGIAILAPFIKPCNLSSKPQPMVKSAYQAVEDLPDGSVVMVSMDFDPASTPELAPFLKAVLLQLKRKNIKLVFATTWYAAPPLVKRYLAAWVDQPIPTAPDYEGPPDRAYVVNKDYVYLGFREGREAMISRMGKSIWETFDGTTDDGAPLSQIPWMQKRKALEHFDLIVLIGAGYPGIKEYVQLVQSRYDLDMIGACTAVSTTEYTPYFQAGQLEGLIGGMAGSAEYEVMVGNKSAAVQGNDVLNAGYGVVIVAILFGNFIYFAGRRRQRRLQRGEA